MAVSSYLLDILQNLLPTFIIFLVVLWALTKLFRFKDGSVKKAFLVMIVFFLFSMVYSIFSLFFNYYAAVYMPILDAFLALMNNINFLLNYAVLLLLIKKAYGENWKKTFVVLILTAILAIVLSLIWVSILYPQAMDPRP